MERAMRVCMRGVVWAERTIGVDCEVIEKMKLNTLRWFGHV